MHLSPPPALFSRHQIETIIKMIGDHFLAKKICWFIKYHFMRLTNLKPKY